MSATALFICVGTTDYQALGPVAEELSEDTHVEFLLLSSFLDIDSDPRTASLKPADIPYETRVAGEYTRFSHFKALPIGMSLPRAAIQRVLLDNVSHEIGFRVDELFDEVEPDLLVSSVDQPPLIRHLIAEAHDRNITSVTIQHGFYEYALTPDTISNSLISPIFENSGSRLERAKRRVGFRYGITEYTHPYLDRLFTIGDFFTSRIGELRSDYPCFGKTKIHTVGSPEFDAPVQPYSPEVDTVLFLSQQQYESGVWDRQQQEQLMDVLGRLDELYPVTVRPHPKDSEEKTDTFEELFTVSKGRSLSSDIEAHDAVLTVNSTAILQAAIRGKVCAVLQLPWYQVDFDPFTHEYILQVSSRSGDLSTLAQDRTVATQSDYLQSFCYMPGEDDSVPFNSSRELIVDALRSSLPDYT